MFRRHGAILINLLQAVAWLLLLGLPMAGRAISVGNLTFSLGAEENFVAKRVLNNNPSARLYQISVVGIDRPGGHEVRSRPADGELLFAPRQLTLQAGQGEYFKFYYHGPQDNRERYYRVSFREIPTRNRIGRTAAGGSIGIDPGGRDGNDSGGTPAAGAVQMGLRSAGGKRQQQRQYLV